MKITFQNITATLILATVSLVAQATDFVSCDDAKTHAALKGSVCAKVETLLNYEKPDAGKVSLFLRKFPATNKAKGTVWFVTGGPGESGASMYAQLRTLRRGFPNFDLIIPDHRGTGYSTRLCPLEESIESPGGSRLSGAEWETCYADIGRNVERTMQFSITNAAHDLSALIQQNPSTKPVYVYGVSYGTQLVLRLFEFGPLPIKGIILDSLVPLQTAPKWDLSRRSEVVDDIGRKLLKQCDENKDCHRMMGARGEQVLSSLLEKVRLNPEIVSKLQGGNLKRFLGSLLDFPELRARIPHLINDLNSGSDKELTSILEQLAVLQDSLGDFPQLAPSIPLTGYISSSENNLRPELTLADLQLEEKKFLFTSGLPSYLVKPSLPLYAHDKYFGKDDAHLPPTLVLQGTMDPKTHYDGALEHIQLMRAHGKVSLVTVLDAPHFIAMFAPDCFARVNRAFVKGKLKENQTCAM
ncbi:alpha/beta fold hydrolase [Undibacterium sp. Di24W]|uniref:alpha/beta fold hydrolase n=1 Tax=Undibacterium sp. Di24W TaxID=3413033 RepID=UPI003BF38717